MKVGDLVRQSASIGVILRKLQWNDQWIEGVNWDGEPAWWIRFVDADKLLWAYEEEIILIKKGN